MYHLLFFLIFSSFTIYSAESAEIDIAKIFPPTQENRYKLAEFAANSQIDQIYKIKKLIYNFKRFYLAPDSLTNLNQTYQECVSKELINISKMSNCEFLKTIEDCLKNILRLIAFSNFTHFLKLGIDPLLMTEDKSLSKELISAILDKNLYVIDYLISRGADINKCIDIEEKWLSGKNALILAISWGDHITPDTEIGVEKLYDYISLKKYIEDFPRIRLMLTKKILTYQPKLDCIYKGLTPFKIAAVQDDLDILQMFIAKKVPWEGSIKSWDMKTANLHTAVQLYILDNQRAIDSNIYKLNEDIYKSGELTKMLFKAVREGSKVDGNMSIIKNLYAGVSWNLIDENGDTLFDIAIKNNDRLMLLTLLAQDRKTKNAITRKNWLGESPLDKLIMGVNGSFKTLGFILNIFADTATKPLIGIHRLIKGM